MIRMCFQNYDIMSRKNVTKEKITEIGSRVGYYRFVDIVRYSISRESPPQIV